MARRDPDLAVLEGFHPLKHGLRFGAEIELAVSPDPARLQRLAARLAPDIATRFDELVEPISAARFATLCERPPYEPLAAVARRPRFDLTAALAALGPLVVLERPRDPGNSGAAIRVAAAAGAAALLSVDAPDPWSAAALRGSAGLHFALPVAGLDSLPDTVAERGTLVALDPGSEENLGERPLPPNPTLLFGNERDGVSASLLERADRRLRIPMRAGVSSLNLATSVAAVLYSYSSVAPTRR